MNAVTIGVFDAGVGGLPIASLIRRRSPDTRLVYLGDAGRRPYGPRPAKEVAGFVREAERFFVDQGCAAWIIACNTASVVATDAGIGRIPYIDMVAAVQEAVREAPPGVVGLLGTAGTVASGVFPRALAPRTVHQIATEALLRLAEEVQLDDAGLLRSLALDAVDQLRDHGCTSVVMACTDFTCIGDTVREVADGLTVIDPMYDAVDLVLRAVGVPPTGSSSQAVDSDLFCLTGHHPVDMAVFARETLGFDIPKIQLVDIAPSEEVFGS